MRQHIHLGGTPYCKPKEIAIAKLFIIAFTNSPSLLVSIKIFQSFHRHIHQYVDILYDQ